jgi:uridine kinase
MFMPFIDSFLRNLSQNPYEYYMTVSDMKSFPYPPLMLFVAAIGGGCVKLLEFANLNNVFFQNIAFKLPLLFFDCVGLCFLRRLHPNNRKHIGILYFASPIVLYSVYMHGQLDIIPTALLVASLFYMTKPSMKSNVLVILLLTAAILTKQHILMVLPILFLYLLNKYGIKRATTSVLGVCAACALTVFPFLRGDGFLNNVILNSEQNMLIQIFFPFLDMKVFIPLLMLFFVYTTYYSANSANRELLLSFCGILFAVALLFVVPMPGWYVWIVPYVAMFLIQTKSNRFKNLFIYCGLNIAYLIYFVFFRESTFVDLYFLTYPLDCLKLEDVMAVSVSFTVLEGFLAFSILTMYQMGVSENAFYRRKNVPFTIGIAGDSGSGKSTLLRIVGEILGDSKIVKIEGDGDHKWERGEEMWNYFTHLNPKANYLYRQALDIAALRKWMVVERSDYDHGYGVFTEKVKINPKPFIAISGLHSLYLPQLRKLLDLKVYMDTAQSLRIYWKMKRDTNSRNRSPEDIRKQIEERLPDAKKYIIPQREYADLVIRFFDPNMPDDYDENYEVTLQLEITLSSTIDIELLLKFLSDRGFGVNFDFSADLEKQVVHIIPPVLAKDKGITPLDEIAKDIIPQMDDLTDRSLNDADDLRGVLKLVVLAMIDEKIRNA